MLSPSFGFHATGGKIQVLDLDAWIQISRPEQSLLGQESLKSVFQSSWEFELVFVLANLSWGVGV